jgi:hypothetical protein
MTHGGKNTGSYGDSLVTAIAGHSGYIGKILRNSLDNAALSYCKIPSFRYLSVEEIDLAVPEGKVVLINASGSTPKLESRKSEDIYSNNVESVKKLINALKNRLHSVLHMSTTHLDFPEYSSAYVNAKREAEEYLSQMAFKFSFEIVNLRLPTIWSKQFLKRRSLLDDITSPYSEELETLLRFPKANIHVAPENSFEIQIRHFLSGSSKKIGFDSSNSWTGNVMQLVDLLEAGVKSRSSTENELKQIFQHWKLEKLDS